MFIIGHILNSLALLFNMVAGILSILLAVRVILSWFCMDPYNELVRTLYRITGPILMPFQRIPFLRMGMIDFSPIAAFIVISVLNNLIVGILRTAAARFF